jgi:hypothetical protein
MSDWADTVPLDNSRFAINGDFRGARNRTMLHLLGNPRGDYSQECQGPTNPRIKDLVVVEDVGPFKVRGLKPAVAGLKNVFDDVRKANKDVYERLGNVGMLCCRFVRGSTSAISNHSWGTAIDLTIDGILDKRGNNRAQKGLFELRPHFNKHGFFWGVAFPTEDAMHFEASDQLMWEWHKKGLFGDTPEISKIDSVVEFGDRGPEVLEVQNLIALRLPQSLEADGIFGPAAYSAQQPGLQ